MTNYEAISAKLYPYSVDDNLIEVSCIDNGLERDDVYSPKQKTEVAMTVISILRNLIALSGENHGGYSLSYDVNGLKTRIYQIAQGNGFTDIADEFNSKPQITFL